MAAGECGDLSGKMTSGRTLSGKIWGHLWCKTEELIKEYASSGNVRGQWLTKLKKNRRESLLHRTEYSNEGKDELAKVTTSIP